MEIGKPEKIIEAPAPVEVPSEEPEKPVEREVEEVPA